MVFGKSCINYAFLAQQSFMEGCFMKNVSVFFMHKRARIALKGTGIAFTVSVVSFLCFFAFLGVASFFESIFMALVEHTPMSYIVGYLLSFGTTVCVLIFLISPLWRGIHAFVLGYLLNSRIERGAIFSFYTAKKRYLYAVRVAASSLLRIALFLTSLFFVLRIGRLLSLDLLRVGECARAVLVLSITVLFSLLLLVVFCLFSVRDYLLDAAFVSAPLLSYKQVRAISKYAVRGHISAVFKHWALLFSWFLVSLLCLGAPLLFVLPYAFMSKSVLSLTLLRK